MFRRTLSVIVALVCLGTSQARAETNILFILDGSNSMWGQIDNTSKMEIAKQTLSKLVNDLPAEANLGLMAYGHNSKSDCNDVELLSAFGKSDAKMVTTLIHTIQPTGKTPIANALIKSKEAFKGHEGQNNHILLVSDGIESCDGDPCAVAKSLQEAGLDIRAHVIGFGVSKEEGKQLTCIAKNTGGKYFDVADANAFNDAVKEVTKIAKEEPKPEPVSTVAFEDNFDGVKLAEHWDVLNPNSDQYIVEDGNLLLIGKDMGGLSNAKSSNILQLMNDLPAGDWTITLKVKPEFQTGHDQLSFGLYTDEQNYVATNIYATDDFCCRVGNRTHNIVLQTAKVSKGKKTMFEDRTREMLDSGTNDFKTFVDTKGANQEFTVKLVKKGRNYQSMLHYDGNDDEKGNPIWVETDVISSLRAPKQFVMNAGQTEAVTGESVFEIHSVKIESQK